MGHLERWGLGYRDDAGEGSTVAILDGGVAPLDVFGRLERIDPSGGPDHSPPSEHATRCAGLIAASGVGLAPKAHLLSIHVSAGHRVDPVRVTDALELVSARGVPIVSCSFVLDALSA